MKKKIAIAIIVILAAGAAAWALYHFVFSKNPASGQEKIYVQSVGSLQSYGGYGNRYNGVVDTQKTEKTEFDSNYKLKEILVEEGSSVKAGDPLFTYDTESIELEIDQIELEIQKLTTDVENNSAQIDELTKLMNNAPDYEQLDYSTQIAELRTDIAQEQYDIKSKQAEIRKKKASMENATVYAGMDGIVKKIADPNALSSGSDSDFDMDYSGNSDTAFITIMAEGDFRIKGSISEANIYEIHTDEKVIVRSRVNEDFWTGTITSIDTQTTEENTSDMMYDSGVERATRYPFYVELDSTEGLMLGQHVTIEADTGIDLSGEGIWLGSGFIAYEEDGSSYVWAAASEGAPLEKRSVVLGQHIEETDQYEISSGLSENEYIAWPDSYCHEGAPTTSEAVVPENENVEGDWNMNDETYEPEEMPGSGDEEVFFPEELETEEFSGS